MTHLLWPTRSQQYFLLASKFDTTLNDELEEFNEAPHVRAERSNPYSSRNTGHALHYSVHDVSFPESVSFSNAKKSSNLNTHNNRINGAALAQSNGNGAAHNNFIDENYVEDKDTSMLIQP